MDYEYNDYELLYMVKDSEDALSMILSKYEGFIKKISYNYYKIYKNVGVDIEDLIQEGRIAIVLACNSFSDYKNVLFYSYAILCIKRRLFNYIRTFYFTVKNRTFLECESLDDLGKEYSDYIHPLDMSISYELTTILKKFSYDLSFTACCIFNLRICDFSYKEISDLLDIPIKQVDNKILFINKKLKKYLLESDFCL